jgi:16S rRNA processing protein rimM
LPKNRRFSGKTRFAFFASGSAKIQHGSFFGIPQGVSARSVKKGLSCESLFCDRRIFHFFFGHLERRESMERLIIAEVLKPQGIRGELKIKTYTDAPEDVRAFKTVYIDKNAYKVLSFRVGEGSFAYLGLRGIPDRNAAELLRGKKIEGDREEAPALEEGRYYIVDILGLTAVTEDGDVLGTVKDISPLSSEVYTLEKDGKQILFPAVRGVVKKVDLENRRLIVDKKRFNEVAVY